MGEDKTACEWDNRYVIKKKLGAGSSACVWLAYDKQTSGLVALKHFEQWKGNEYQCRKEIKNMEFLRKQDPDCKHVPRLHRVFHQDGRPCLVMEFVGGTTLKQEIRDSKKRGVSIPTIRRAMQCLVQTFEFLASKKVDMLHGDLKPDNVILCEDQENVQLIDYGLASFTGRMQKNMYIQSRWYRSPEVLLGLPATPQVDMWSLGCLLVELFAGVPPFKGHDSFDQMMLIVDAIGLPDEKLRSRCEEVTVEKLDELGVLVARRWAKVDKETLAKGLPIESMESHLKTRLLTHRKRRHGETEKEREQLVDLIWKLLVNDPNQRLTPSQARNHPFLADPNCTTAASLSVSLSAASPQEIVQRSPSRELSESPSRLSSASTLSSSVSSLDTSTESARSSTEPSRKVSHLSFPISLPRIKRRPEAHRISQVPRGGMRGQ